MPLLLDTTPEFNARRQVFSADSHFQGFATGGTFSSLLEDSGTAGVVDGAGGILAMVTGGTINDEIYVYTTNNIFLLAAGKPIKGSWRLKYSEASTTTAAVAFGFMSAVAADAIPDGGVGLKSSYSGANFFKSNGGTLWNTECSIGSTRTGATLLSNTIALDKTNHTAPSTTYSWFDILLQPIDATNCRADFLIDNVQVSSTLFTYTSAAAMMAWMGVKCGTGAAVTVNVDYMGAEAKL
jgi:hypothetical protein